MGGSSDATVTKAGHKGRRPGFGESRVHLSRTGLLAGLAAMALAGTATAQPHNLIIFVADRFLVTITTTNVPSEQVTAIGESLPLEDLAALK